jgi:hypothetical protein
MGFASLNPSYARSAIDRNDAKPDQPALAPIRYRRDKPGADAASDSKLAEIQVAERHRSPPVR